MSRQPLNLGTYRRCRTAYLLLSPAERRGMTPERLTDLVFNTAAAANPGAAPDGVQI